MPYTDEVRNKKLLEVIREGILVLRSVEFEMKNDYKSNKKTFLKNIHFDDVVIINNVSILILDMLHNLPEIIQKRNYIDAYNELVLVNGLENALFQLKGNFRFEGSIKRYVNFVNEVIQSSFP